MSFNQKVTECLPNNPLTFVFTLYKPDLENEATLIQGMWINFKNYLDQQQGLCFEPDPERNLENIKNLNLFGSAFRTPQSQTHRTHQG